nr:J domain-containing protein [Brachybacterium sacelli]
MTHYDTLGVPRDASRVEITAAFRAQMRALHSDAGGDDQLAKHVSSAYNVLSNASRRAIYDRTLAVQAPSAASAPAKDSKAGRHRVFHPEHTARATSMLEVDPSQWNWHIPADAHSADGGVKAPRRQHVRTILLMLAFVAWALAGAAAATTLGLPLARIGALSTAVALLCGLGAHLVWSVLVIARGILRRWGSIAALLITAAGAFCIHLDAGTPLPMLGSVLCLLASALTTYASFGVVLARVSRDEGIIDSSFITQVGATSLGPRNADIERLLCALTGAFGHRDGVRVILLPDRVTPRPNTSQVRSQVAVVVGRSVHLIAIPPLGADGLEISGSEVISNGLVHRNVVRDEVQALCGLYGRGADVHGYVVPTQLSTASPAVQEVDGISFGSLDQVIDAVGTIADSSLDQPNTLFRHRALESMSLLV